MTKIKLVNGTIVNAESVEVVNGTLKISTTDLTVEELAAIFSDKSNTNHIELLTEGGTVSGYKTGFTSFAGITYNADGLKTVELFQPVDISEKRISDAEGSANAALSIANTAKANANSANANASNAENIASAMSEKVDAVETSNAVLSATVDDILTNIIPSLNVDATETV